MKTPRYWWWIPGAFVFVAVASHVTGAGTEDQLGQVLENSKTLASEAASKTSPGEVLVWLITGGLVGMVIGAIVTRKPAGFGLWMNLAVGLVGALIGGLLFDLLGIDLGIGELVLRYDDFLAAFIGAGILVIAGGVFKSSWLKAREPKKSSGKS